MNAQYEPLLTPRFHQDCLLPFAQREKREETGSERETERQKGLIILLLCFMIRCHVISPVSLVQSSIENQGNKLMLF